MNPVVDYLKIPRDYDGNRYSLSWSASGEAIESHDHSTFAFASQIAFFLEGYGSNGPLIHFSYILTMLYRLVSRQGSLDEPGLPLFGPGRELLDRSDALARSFRDAKYPYRNAGALCAWLCQDIPPAVAPPDWREVCHGLQRGHLAHHLAVSFESTSPHDSRSSLPPLTALDFERRFLNALKKLTPEEIEGWLEYGRRPHPFAAERMADTIEALRPKTLEGVLGSLENRERLAAAVPMVAQFLSALSLPPRRLAHHALPTGGYADVATRGRPEQILPSQFAIDDIEFLRRFAENELLYFHREEPHAPLTEELILVLDQGIRTWGKIRHALAASGLALAKLSGRKKMRLALTSTALAGQLFDPLLIDEETLGLIWESSDLSSNPSEALERVLETPPTGRRDLIVLSHPRNLADPEFGNTARRLDDSTRLFSVAIDEPGSVQFREWRRGVAVKVADFRVDFNPPSNFRKNPSRAGSPTDPRGWKGDIEPVPFPFRFGVTQPIKRPLFDFDESGRWLLLCTSRGLLHAWKLDGTATEILPRGIFGESVLEQVEVVLGVADGFVVGGRVGKSLVAMHYDLSARTAKSYTLGPSFESEWLWFYSRELHSIGARGRGENRAIDLSNQQVHGSNDSMVEPGSRAARAFAFLANQFVPPPRLPVVDEAELEPLKGGFVRLDRSTGKIHLERVDPSWKPFTPNSDGKPMLKECKISYAQWRGGVLALVVTDSKQRTNLQLFQSFDPGDREGPRVVTKELDPPSVDPTFLILSHDGRLIARRLKERQLEVRETFGTGQPIFTTTKGKIHNAPRVTLGRYGMQIHVGKHISLIRWDREELSVSTVNEGSTRSEFDIVTWPLETEANRSTPMPQVVKYDQARFTKWARAELIAVLDVFGQVSLFDSNERLVAMFVAFRSHVAAWTPDGTRFGPSQEVSPLLNGPATPHAARIIGKALKAACDAASFQQGKV